MIEFGCTKCGRLYRVAEDKAGKKSKCADCYAVITVPTHDDDELFFDNINPDLASLLAAATELVEEDYPILKCVIVNEDVLSITVSCSLHRSQVVGVSCIEAIELEYFFISTIGNVSTIKDKNTLHQLLIDSSSNGLFYLHCENDELSIRSSLNLGVDTETAISLIVMLGKFTDEIEEKYFLIDLE